MPISPLMVRDEDIASADREAGVQSWSCARFFSGEEVMPEHDCQPEEVGYVMRARQDRERIESEIFALAQRKRELDLFIESRRKNPSPPVVEPAPFLAAFRKALEKRDAHR